MRTYFLGLLIVSQSLIFAQNYPQIDSLNLQAYQLRTQNPQSCVQLAQTALNLAIQANYHKGQSDAYQHMGDGFRYQLMADSAVFYLEKGMQFDQSHGLPGLDKKYNSAGIVSKNENRITAAINYFERCMEIRAARNDIEGVAKVLNNMGNAYKRVGYYELAFEQYVQALKIKDSLKDVSGAVTTQINMANVLAEQRRFGAAVQLQKENIEYFRKTDNTPKLALALLNYANVMMDSLQRYKELSLKKIINGQTREFLDINYTLEQPEVLDTLLPVVAECKELFYDLGDVNRAASCIIMEGIIQYRKGLFREALNNYAHALKQLNPNKYEVRARCLSNMGLVYAEMSDCQKALDYYHQSYTIAQEKNIQHLLLKLHVQFSNCYQQTANYDLAFAHLKTYEILKLRNEKREVSRRIDELNKKFELEKKEKEIAKAKLAAKIGEAERSKLLNTIFLVLILLGFVVILFLLLYRNMKLQQKRRAALHNQAINKLLTDQDLKIFDAEVQGQDKERRRIAEELHDRVGMVLSAAKMHLEAASKPEKVTHLLDKAIEDTRQISHNLISGVLTKFGLVKALADLQQAVESEKRLHFELEINQFDQRLPAETELNLYRIIQELLSNTLKHSGAKTFSVKLEKKDRVIELTVADDGKGMQTDMTGSGIGLKNINSRVNKIGGGWKIQSSPGEGTCTVIILDI